MDCNEFNEKIDLFVDGTLNEADKQQLLRHASACQRCGKALDEALRLKQALGNMAEAEPPAGLAASAVKKARRRRIPVYAYASVAAAAVIALLVVFSPQMTQQPGAVNEIAAEQKAYDAQADMALEGAQDGSGMTESAAAREWGIKSAEDSGVMESSEAASDDMVAICTPCDVYSSEEELLSALQEEAGKTRGIAVYYRPASLPEGAQLVQIELSGDSLRWVYGLEADSSETLIYEWYIARTPEDIQNWSEQTMLGSDNLAHSFSHSEDYFWSAQARFNENGEMAAADTTAVNVYWAQGDAALHAQLPVSFAEQDILAYCTMEQVPIG